MSEDERITRDAIAGPQADLIVQVADARNLRRALVLTAQLAQLNKPVVLVLNMIDEAFARGIAVDVPALAAELQIPSSKWSRSRPRILGTARRAGVGGPARCAGASARQRPRGLGTRTD
jgi:ferrous iron transport protein B